MANSVFQGSSALTLDAKGRINVPVRHRDALTDLCAGQLTLTEHPTGCLIVFPRPAWEAFRERLLQLPMEADGWRRLFIGSALDVDIDSAGRLHISPELRAAAGLGKDVLLVGVGSRLELWDAAQHAAQKAEVKRSAMPEAVKGFVF